MSGAAPVLTLAGPEHVLILLGHTDRHDTRLARSGLPPQVRTHHLLLAIGLAERHHRHLLRRGEGTHSPAERCADLLHDRRGRDRISQMLPHERGHLTTNLQIWHVAVEIHPIQRLDVQPDMPLKQIIHGQSCHSPS